jgi:GGDEF domain-containing protein
MDVTVGGERVHLSISLGVVTFPGCEATDVDGLIRVADEALYRAKAGRPEPRRRRVARAGNSWAAPPRC